MCGSGLERITEYSTLEFENVAVTVYAYIIKQQAWSTMECSMTMYFALRYKPAEGETTRSWRRLTVTGVIAETLPSSNAHQMHQEEQD